MARYFSATAMGSKLYPAGIGERGPWRSERLVYYPEAVARIMASPCSQDSLVSKGDDLRRIVRGSTLPAVKVWVHEDLESVARQMWEEQR